MKSKGFTILTVIDSNMRAAEDLQAVLGVFDGEIRVTEKETPEGINRRHVFENVELEIPGILNSLHKREPIYATQTRMRTRIQTKKGLRG